MTHKLSGLPPTCMGQLLLYGGFMDAELLKEALQDQQEDAQHLGDLLETRHTISTTEKQALLHLQEHIRQLPLNFKADGCLPDSLQLCLGQLLLENGEITREQLDRALAEHQAGGKRLGEVLVKQHALSPARLDCWLTLQKKLITAAAAACLMLGCSGTAMADDKDHRHFWEHFRFNKLKSTDQPQKRSAWTQSRQSVALSGLNTVQKAFGELVRSQDGSTVISVSQNGLEIVKRF